MNQKEFEDSVSPRFSSLRYTALHNRKIMSCGNDTVSRGLPGARSDAWGREIDEQAEDRSK